MVHSNSDAVAAKNQWVAIAVFWRPFKKQKVRCARVRPPDLFKLPGNSRRGRNQRRS
jgi:hypothetical protein